MKTKIGFALAVTSAMAISSPTAAQTFSGTNTPNTSTNSFSRLGQSGRGLPHSKTLAGFVVLSRFSWAMCNCPTTSLIAPHPAKDSKFIHDHKNNFTRPISFCL
jgi:hypothetical protein